MSLVSVVMPVYNGARYVAQATESILRQTLADLELLVIDDGSTDGTAEIVAGFHDPRVRLLRSAANEGIIRALNRGLDAATGAFVARMDADDVSLPERLAEQVGFLGQHPDVGIVGSRIVTFEGGEERTPPCITDPEAVVCRLLFGNPIVHPTVMMRAEILRGAGLRYGPSFPHAEDYDLWARACTVTRLANVPEVLLHYRLHDGSVSRLHHEIQLASADGVRGQMLARLGIVPSGAEVALHRAISSLQAGDDAHLTVAEAWLLRLARANACVGAFPARAFVDMLVRHWSALRRRSAPLGVSASRFLDSPEMAGVDIAPLERAMLSRSRRDTSTAQGGAT